MIGAIARAATVGDTAGIRDKPTAALGAKDSRSKARERIVEMKRKGLPIVRISHNMPHVFDVADRIHLRRPGCRHAVVVPGSRSDAAAIMTGVLEPPKQAA